MSPNAAFKRTLQFECLHIHRIYFTNGPLQTENFGQAKTYRFMSPGLGPCTLLFSLNLDKCSVPPLPTAIRLETTHPEKGCRVMYSTVQYSAVQYSTVQYSTSRPTPIHMYQHSTSSEPKTITSMPSACYFTWNTWLRGDSITRREQDRSERGIVVYWWKFCT
jgi:hypothetical protein